MDIITEIIIDFIETIFVDNSEKIVNDKKVIKFIRYPVILITLLLCGLITLGPILLGIFLFKQNIIGAIIFILIGIIFSVFIFYEIKKVMVNIKVEKRDLYDSDRNLTGETIRKGEKIPEGRFIVVVLVFIQNSEGKFLIQKRSQRKNGKYATTGGHPKSGESSVQGILTEVEEEIGLKLNSNYLQLYFSGKSEEKRVFWDDYYIKLDIEDIKKLKLQEDEVEDIEWFSESEITELMKQDKFAKNHYEEFKRLIDWLKNK